MVMDRCVSRKCDCCFLLTSSNALILQIIIFMLYVKPLTSMVHLRVNTCLSVVGALELQFPKIMEKDTTLERCRAFPESTVCLLMLVSCSEF